MRAVLLFFFLSFFVLANSQDSLTQIVSSAACNCLSNTKTLEDDAFGDCLLKSFQTNSSLFIGECYKLYRDTSEHTANKFGLEIYRKISVSMIFSCSIYYHFMDSLRNQSLNYITLDSAKSQVELIEKENPTKLTAELYNLKGIIDFKTNRYLASIENFDKALSIDSTNFQSKFLKAWSLEKNRNFHEAIFLYKHLADITGNYNFNIFAALAERKRKDP